MPIKLKKIIIRFLTEIYKLLDYYLRIIKWMFLMLFEDTEFPKYDINYETIIAPFEKEYSILCQDNGPPFKILKGIVELINEFNTPLKQFVITESSFIPRPIFSNALVDYVEYHSLKKNSVELYSVEQVLVHLFSERNWNSEKVTDLMEELDLEITCEEFDFFDDVLENKPSLVKKSVFGRMPVYSEGKKAYCYIWYIKSNSIPSSTEEYHESVQDLWKVWEKFQPNSLCWIIWKKDHNIEFCSWTTNRPVNG